MPNCLGEEATVEDLTCPVRVLFLGGLAAATQCPWTFARRSQKGPSAYYYSLYDAQMVVELSLGSGD